MVDRILKGTGATITVRVDVDGAATDPSPDGATVVVTNTAGTVIVASTPATDTGTGEFSYNLTPTHTATLDTLTATWTYVRDGNTESLQTMHEIVGGFAFTIADARNTPGLNAQNNDTTYRISTSRIVEARTEVERALEQELCFAMVPRYTVETIDGTGGREFMLSWPHVRSIRTVTVDGTALGPSAVALMSVSVTGSVYYPSGWSCGHQNITIGYEHGLQVPPPRARDVALALAKRALTGAPADDRATTMTTDEQTTTFYVPGATEPFDVPAANRFVQSMTLRTGLA